jgi:hypothetical protein
MDDIVIPFIYDKKNVQFKIKEINHTHITQEF